MLRYSIHYFLHTPPNCPITRHNTKQHAIHPYVHPHPSTHPPKISTTATTT